MSLPHPEDFWERGSKNHSLGTKSFLGLIIDVSAFPAFDMEKDRTDENKLIWTRRYEEEEADDLFREEEDPKDEPPMLKEKQKDVKEKGMLQVRTQEDWSQEVLRHLDLDNSRPLTANLQTILDNIERVGKATCYVRRKRNSQERKDFHKKLKDDASLSAEDQKCHEKNYQKALSGKGGSGTGFLVSPKHYRHGWLVITNNHVIMNNEEAKDAVVVFDYLYDNDSQGSKSLSVENVVSKSLRTQSADDKSSLDYSLLTLKCKDSSDEKFLFQHATVDFDESDRVQHDWEIRAPMLAFSHPHGLSKRLSVGYLKGKVQPNPAQNVRHEMPTAPGSSGANFCIWDPTSRKNELWLSAFVHYRASHAIAWQAIAPHFRKK